MSVSILSVVTSENIVNLLYIINFTIYFDQFLYPKIYTLATFIISLEADTHLCLQLE